MYWLVAFLIAFGALAAWWFFLRSAPVYYRELSPERFPWLISSLVTQMRDGGVLVIQHEGSSRFVQFILHSSNPSGPTLGFGFPDADWSRSFFEPVRRALGVLGYTVHESPTGDSNVRRFLEIEISGSVDSWQADGTRIAIAAFEAMGTPVGATYVSHLQGELDSKRIIRASCIQIREALRRQRAPK